MEWNRIAADWPAFTDSVMSRWPELDRERVADMDGDRAALSAHVAEVYGLEPRMAEEQIARWAEGPLPVDAATDETHDATSMRAAGRHIPQGEDVYSEDADFGDERMAEPPIGRK